MDFNPLRKKRARDLMAMLCVQIFSILMTVDPDTVLHVI
jgi:hypothetical protein